MKNSFSYVAYPNNKPWSPAPNFLFFDLSVEGIINTLDLLKPIYLPLATYGHFGRIDLNLPWEKTDMTDKIKNYFKK